MCGGTVPRTPAQRKRTAMRTARPLVTWSRITLRGLSAEIAVDFAHHG